MAALAEFERDIIHESTIGGLDSARKRGRLGRRAIKLTDEKKEYRDCLAQCHPTYVHQRDRRSDWGIGLDSVSISHQSQSADITVETISSSTSSCNKFCHKQIFSKKETEISLDESLAFSQIRLEV